MLSHGEELYGQFMLALQGSTSPAGGGQHCVAGWRLATHAWLPVTPIHDQQDRHIGWMVGHALSDAKVLRGVWKLSVSLTDAALEQQLYRFGGRWVSVI